jgi:hypothetical protein
LLVIQGWGLVEIMNLGIGDPELLLTRINSFSVLRVILSGFKLLPLLYFHFFLNFDTTPE